MREYNIVIVGVGGQGTLLTGKLLGYIANKIGLDVKVSEVHGMSQRGGSVVTYVRMAQKVFSPLVEQKGADVVLAFEALEGLRALPYLKEDGVMLMNIQQILPMPVIVGSAEYPENIPEMIRKHTQLTTMDALALATQAGNVKTVNTVMIGALAARLKIDKSIWLQSLRDVIPAKFIDVNLKAFEMGYSIESYS